MKARLLLVLLSIVPSIICSAQTSPNLENGFKSFGSYDGSRIDTVNLMNGNVMLHVPLLPAYPQRGSISPQYTLYMTSKAWQVQTHMVSDPNVGTFPAYYWSSLAPGVMITSNTGVLMGRDLFESFTGTGQSFYTTGDYTITGPDSSVHHLNAIPGYPTAPDGDATAYESVDGSGYRLITSNPDGNGVMSTATVTDRNGVQFQGNFSTDFSKCGRPSTVTLAAPGNYAPIQDDIPSGDHTCQQFAYSQSAIDSNGNQIGFVSSGEQTPPIPTTDTLGRSMPFAFVPAAPATADPAKCVVPANGTFYQSDLLYYNAPDGSTRYIQRCYATMPIQTSFGLTVGGSTVAEEPGTYSTMAATPLLVTLIQADGTKWTFNYDSYANLTFIGLPTGGSISYTWTMIHLITCTPDLTSIGRAVEYRTVTDNNGNSTQWHYTWGSPGATLTNTVRDPAGNDTVHVFTEIGCSYYEKSTQYYQGPQAGKPIKQVDTTYSPNTITDDTGHAGNVVPISVQTTVNPSGLVSLITKTYDPGYGPGTPIFADVVQEKDYDWGQGQPGPLLRETDTVYKWQKDSSYLTAHLVDLPVSTIIVSPSAAANTKSSCPLTPTTSTNCMAETDYFYDEPITGYLITPTPAITTQHVAPPAGVRGNQTTVSRWLNTSGDTVSSHTQWYDTGEPYQKLDPLRHTTTITYDSAYVGAFATETCSPQTGTVTHCVSGTYDFNTGDLASLTDENNQTSKYGYDYMFHLISAEAPPDPANGNARATTNFSYSDITSPASFPVSITRTKPVTNALTDSAANSFDGLARLITSTHAMPSGPPSAVETTYDDLHATVTVKNPYFTTADPTYGSTITQSDALGRPLTVTEQDGSAKNISYSVVSLTGSTGDCNDTVDEAGHQHRACTDALGRLVEVDEPNPASVNVAAQATLSFSGSLGVRNGVGSHSATHATGTITVTGTAPAPETICDPDITPTISNPCPGAHTVSDHGTVTLTVGGHAETVNYTASEASSTVAQALETAINSDAGALIHVNSVSGGSLIVQSVAAGSGTGYSWSISSQSQDLTGTFGPGPGPFSGAPGSLTSGTDAYAGITVYDKGTLTLKVGSFSGQVCYGRSTDCSAPPPQCPTGNSTAVQVACIAASVLNSASSPVSAIYSGTASLTITDKTAGRGGNGLAVTVTAASTQTLTTFSPPSFSSPGTTLGSGLNAGDVDNQPFVTLYSYDALGDLLCVEQHGGVSGTGCSSPASADATSPWRVRRFTYDSLGRLLSASNPESNTAYDASGNPVRVATTYSYDADGNLLQKTSPAANQTGTATQTISYCYDEMNRVTGKAYSAQSCPLPSPAVTYTYDSGANAKGHLTGVTDQAGSASYSYDTLGRLSSEARMINGISKSLSYDYNLDGSLKALHYPSGAVVTYTPDSAGRFTSAVDTADAINYVTSATYQADGQMTGFVSGNGGAFAGITSAFSYNKRLQPVNMSANAPSQTVFSIGYEFHAGNGTAATGSDNGNVWNIYNFRDRTRDQAFNYDMLNRLTAAQNAGTDCTAATVNGKTEYWGNSYGYDPWGNLLAKSVTKCSAENMNLSALPNNQLSGYGYDAAGNMTSDPTDSTSSTYDAENRIATASTPQGIFTYTYDADGNRVEKSGGGSGTLYWYMTPGIVAESDLSGNLKSEYVFFNGERVARRDLPSGSVAYYFSDHLKTASIVTDSAGNIKAESDYYPWGGELRFVNNDSNHYKFTGKERDSESGLDYFGARYYSNGLGRFITPDWAAKAVDVPYAEFSDPQSLNLYSYVRNVPTSRADSNGHCPDGMDICFMPQLAQNEAYKEGIHEGAKQGLIALGVAATAAVGGPLLARAGAAMMLRVAPLATAIGKATINARDEVSGALSKLNGAVQSGALKLSTVTQGRLGGAINAAEEHMTDSDIKGAIRQAATGVEQGGDHLQEIKNTAQSFQNLRDSLSGALKDPKLSDSSRQLFTDTVSKLNKAIDAVKNIHALQDRR